MTRINLATAAGVREILARHGLRAKKKLGQHFLVDGRVLEKIINSAEISGGDFVLEIGPGIGGMTQALLRAGAHVVAVELDRQLVPLLAEMFAGENFRVVQGDILRTDLSEILPPPNFTKSSQEFSDDADFEIIRPKKTKVVANLPYYITTPVIFRLLESGAAFESITVMVQREVAARMAAAPGTKDYGALTLAVQYYADVTLVANVPVNCFMPRPAVDSAVVKLRLLPAPRVAADKTRLFAVIHAAFGKRRKTLLNALDSESMGKNALAEALTQAGINPQARGETLDIFEFARIAKIL